MTKVNIVTRPKGKRTGLTVYSDGVINNLKCSYELVYPRPPKVFERLSNVGPLSFLNGYYTSLSKDIDNKQPTHFMDQFMASPLMFHKMNAVVTVHDLAYVRHPEWFKAAKHLKFNFLDKTWHKMTLNGLKKANALIAVSEFTKKEIIKLLGYPKERIFVTHEGVTKEFCCKNLKREETTILYVGSEEIRKNLETLISAVSRVKQKFPHIKLIKVGKPHWPKAREDLINQIKELGLENNIVFKDYVEDLTEEYNKATVFIFPSLYEGFGLPVLEAMACGCPVICSSATSLPEVGGDAVLYFNPKKSEELAEKISKLLKNKKLQKDLSNKGLKRAKQFTWAKTAQKTLEVYKKIQ